MKNIITLLLLIFIPIGTSACEHVSSERAEDKLINEISYWSSEKFQGRLTGTEGNKKAQDEIAKRFKEMKLEPVLAKEYTIPFEMGFYNPEKIQANLVVKFNNGQEEQFKYGKDWIDNYTDFDTDVELPISFSDDAGKIFITDTLNSEGQNAAVQFVQTSTFRKNSLHAISGAAEFQISDSFYKYLKTNENKIKQIQLHFSGVYEDITAYNVAGKIIGNGGDVEKQAIVISAHFDHMGTTGDTVFLGSVDNATGIAGLLNLATILKEDSKKQPFASDILFVAFNAEESALAGSNDFVNKISSEYSSIVNINLDTIGVNNGGKVTFYGEEVISEVISEELMAIAKENHIESGTHIEKTATAYSDHIPFIKSNYQAITISQESFHKIHTVEDNIDYVDSKPLKEAIEIVQEFVRANHNTTFEMMIK